jgi:polysaccharide export outer membrane protein
MKSNSGNAGASNMRFKLVGLAILVFAAGAAGQGTAPVKATAEQMAAQNAACAKDVRSTYTLGPGDELQISGPELEEMANKTNRIDGEGDLQAPLVGRIHIAGMTVQQAEAELDKRLSAFIKHPQVSVEVKELRSQPASVLGAVNTPGVHQVEGHKTLLEMISMAGGIRQDAGYSIRITRQSEWGCIPLPGATTDPSGRYSVAQVNLQGILEGKMPENNIQIFPHDVISIPKAQMVYVTGDVKKNGGFVLGENQTMSVLQAVSLAEGLTSTADKKHSRIMRLNPGSDERVEIPVDLKNIMDGKAPDVPMQSYDILLVPGSTGKKAALRIMEAAISTGTGLAVYRP